MKNTIWWYNWFREYLYDKDYLPNIQSGIVDGSAGIKDDYRFVSTPNTGYITDAVILAHEVAHYIVGISENATDHMISESLAIFTEFWWKMNCLVWGMMKKWSMLEN